MGLFESMGAKLLKKAVFGEILEILKIIIGKPSSDLVYSNPIGLARA